MHTSFILDLLEKEFKDSEKNVAEKYLLNIAQYVEKDTNVNLLIRELYDFTMRQIGYISGAFKEGIKKIFQKVGLIYPSISISETESLIKNMSLFLVLLGLSESPISNLFNYYVKKTKIPVFIVGDSFETITNTKCNFYYDGARSTLKQTKNIKLPYKYIVKGRMHWRSLDASWRIYDIPYSKIKEELNINIEDCITANLAFNIECKNDTKAKLIIYEIIRKLDQTKYKIHSNLFIPIKEYDCYFLNPYELTFDKLKEVLL